MGALSISEKLTTLIRETISDVLFEEIEFTLDVPEEYNVWNKRYEEMTFDELIEVIDSYADDYDELMKILTCIDTNKNLTDEEKEYLAKYIDNVGKPLILRE